MSENHMRSSRIDRGGGRDQRLRALSKEGATEMNPTHDDDGIELDEETQELKQYHSMLVGIDLRMAEELIRGLENQFNLRVMRKDGRNCIGTTDYNPKRVNVSVQDGIIKSIINIG